MVYQKISVYPCSSVVNDCLSLPSVCQTLHARIGVSKKKFISFAEMIAPVEHGVALAVFGAAAAALGLPLTGAAVRMQVCFETPEVHLHARV